MLGKVKNTLRRYRRDGKAVPLINALMTFNQLRKNTNDFLKRKEILQKIESKAFGSSPEDLVAFTMDAAGGFMRPIQNRYEITELVRFVAGRRPKAILEIGTAKGGTLFLFCQAAAEDATIVSVDLPYGRNGGGYPQWKSDIYKKFVKRGQRMHLLQTNSHLVSTRDQIRGLVPQGFDLIMIDGDHSYEGVKTDFGLYSSLLAPGGVVVLHDILPNRFDAEIEVNRFWDELKSEKDVIEIVADYNQGNLGIGIVKNAR